jgi:hypothetical protein
MLSKSGNDSQLLAMFTHRIKLICESSLELLTGYVGELSLSNQRFGFSAYEFLLKNNNLRGVRLLVFQLGNLIGDLLLALEKVSLNRITSGVGLVTVATRLDRRLNIADALDGDAVLIVPVHILILKLTDLID